MQRAFETAFGCLVAVLFCGGEVSGQDAPASGDREPRVFRWVGSAPDGEALTTPMRFGFEDRGIGYLVELGPDKTAAAADGQSVPASRIRRAGNEVDVLDTDGLVLARISACDRGGEVRVFRERARLEIGVRLAPVTVAVAARVGSAADGLRRVWWVAEDSGAAAAGIRVGDIITGVQDRPLDTQRLRREIAAKQAGDRLQVEVFRDGERRQFAVELRRATSLDRSGWEQRRPRVRLEDGMIFFADAGPSKVALEGVPTSARSGVDEVSAASLELLRLRRRVRELEERLADRKGR